MDEKRIILIDFDGVIHQYDAPWTDEYTISDHVVPGFFEWAEEASRHFRLVIYSARSKDEKGREAIGDWLMREWSQWRTKRLGVTMAYWRKLRPHHLGFELASEKPKAFLTIDDRAISFQGDWSAPELTPEAMMAYKPWNKREDK